MQEWYALDLIERCREGIPDLTRDEEDLIFSTAMSGTTLYLRCHWWSAPANGQFTDTEGK